MWLAKRLLSHRRMPHLGITAKPVVNCLERRCLHRAHWYNCTISPPVPKTGRAFATKIRGTTSKKIPAANFYRDLPEGVTPIPIAIVGRPNVGKSTLFNRLQSRTNKKHIPKELKNAIVSNRAGTTRDRKDTTVAFGGLVLRMIDTGGLESERAIKDSSLLGSMQTQVYKAVAEAAAVLFVVDAREGITPVDIEIAKKLRGEIGNAHYYRDLDPFSNDAPKEVPVILVANKAEGSYIGPYLNDCYELGFGDPVVLSAYHNEGTEDLYDRLCLEVGHLQMVEEDSEEEHGIIEDDSEDGSERTDETHNGTEASDGLELDNADEGADEAPSPTLPWLAQPSEEQKRALRYFATQPGDPLGELDPGLKASVLHRDASEQKNFWLDKPQRALQYTDASTRDFVMQFRRLEDAERPLRIAVIGYPNTGKSSVINALLQEERCVVDPMSGTTMDAIVSDWTFKDRAIKLMDTSGIIRGWKQPGMYSDFPEPGMSTRKAIRKADVCILCIDGNRTRLFAPGSTPTKFEVRLGNFVADEGKCLMIAINKWDLVPEEDQQRYRTEILDRIKEKFSSVKGIPVVFMSARYNLNLPTLMTRILALEKRWNARLPTGKLNDWLQAWMIRWPPPWRDGQKKAVKYMTQVKSRPPMFVMWSNTTAGEFPRNYLRQLQNAMRDEFRISGVPIKFTIRSTLWPKPRKKMKPIDVLRWQRVGPEQAKAVKNLTSAKITRRERVTD